jgi:hypothetical protein
LQNSSEREGFDASKAREISSSYVASVKKEIGNISKA